MATSSTTRSGGKTRQELKRELVTIEKQIYELETGYLDETKNFVSIFTGFDGYLSREKTKVKKSNHNDERLFSLSSFTSPASRREELKKHVKPNNDGIMKTNRKKKRNDLLDEGQGNSSKEEAEFDE